MKKSITTIILAIILLAFGLFELISVNSVISNLDKDIGNLIVLYEENSENIDIFFDTINEIKEKWEDSEENMNIMFNYKDLDMITDCLSRLTSFTKNNDFNNAIAEIYLLKDYTERSFGIMGFNFKNVM